MAATTDIDWTDATPNPFTQKCTPVSDECLNCFAQDIANHWHGRGYFTSGPPVLIPARLLLVWSSKKMREAYKRFVCSMTDPLHPGIPVEHQAIIWAWMAANPRNVHQYLTKRHGVLCSRLNSPEFEALAYEQLAVLEDMALDSKRLTAWREQMLIDITYARENWRWPLPNVWAGVSAGTRESAALRLPKLAAAPAATRIISCEPLLEELDITPWLKEGGIHQVIGGGESGRRHRPVEAAWARSLRDQCLAHNVPFWWKQWGGVTHKSGGDLLDGQRWKQWPTARTGALV
jgi:protein gp37